MSTDPKKSKDELTDAQAENIAGGRNILNDDPDGAMDPTSIRNLEGSSAATEALRDAASE